MGLVSESACGCSGRYLTMLRDCVALRISLYDLAVSLNSLPTDCKYTLSLSLGYLSCHFPFFMTPLGCHQPSYYECHTSVSSLS